MQLNYSKKWTRILLALCMAAMLLSLTVPLWKIDLVAPQYPEGLSLSIYPNRLSGNVEIINGLNHYIGMKTLHTDDFVEFTVLPYMIVFFAVLFLLIVVTGSRKLLYGGTILFVCFGVLALYDFWKWEYDYGHNLDPDAAIIVPGMAYQPPLIGYKQLLNFSAYSFPAAGGWLFAGTGIVLLLASFFEWKIAARSKTPSKVSIYATFFLLACITSCNTGPEPINPGTDHCDYCKMTITDQRFGAELVTAKGKIYKFDDIKCLLSWQQSGTKHDPQQSNVYLTNFIQDHKLIPAAKAFILQSEQLHSPMGGQMAAFDNRNSPDSLSGIMGGQTISWQKLFHHDR